MRYNVFVLLFTFKILLCLESAGMQLYAQVPSTQTLRLMSQIGLGYEIICIKGLYTENNQTQSLIKQFYPIYL